MDKPALGRVTVQAAVPDGVLQHAQHQVDSARSLAFQPTIRREKASRTLASHSGPSPVGMRE